MGHDVPGWLFDWNIVHNLKEIGLGKADVSFLFGGIGDARNMYATIAAMATPTRIFLQRANMSFLRSVHLTIVDFKPAIFARNLVMFDLFAQYNALRKQGAGNKALDEIACAMAYVFIAFAYPPFVHDAVQNSLRRLIGAIEAGQEVFSWVYLPQTSQAPILHYLKQWQGPALRAHTDNRTPRHISRDRLEFVNQQVHQLLMSLGPWPLADAVDIPVGCEDDAVLVKKINVLAPPGGGGDPELTKLLEAVKASPEQSATDSLDDYISNHWKTNVTLIDLDWEQQLREDGSAHADRYGVYSTSIFDPIQVASAMTGTDHSLKEKKAGVISRLSDWFSKIAEDIQVLIDASDLTIEVICEEVAAVMEKLQYDCYDYRLRKPPADNSDTPAPKCTPDPTKFPKQFDRIHMSNIPDYTGGLLNPALFARPCLKPTPSSEFRFTNLVNRASFTSHDQINAEYTLLPSEPSIKDHFQLVRRPSHATITVFRDENYMVWAPWLPNAHPLPFQNLPMTRPQLEHWLHAWFLKIILPYPRGMLDGHTVNSPFNLTIFLRLVTQMHTVGYQPTGWPPSCTQCLQAQ